MADFEAPVPLEETPEADDPMSALMAIARQQQAKRDEALARLRGLSRQQGAQAQGLRTMSLLTSMGQNPLLQGLQREAGQQGAQLQGMAMQAESRADAAERGPNPLSMLRAMGQKALKPPLSSDPNSPASKAAQARVKAIIPGIADADLATVTAASEPDFLKYRSMTERRGQSDEQFAKTLGFKWADLNQDERLAVMRVKDAQEARAASAAARKEENIERQTLKLSERLENMPSMANDLATLSEFAQKPDVPGVGATGLVPAPLLTKEGAKARQAVRGVVGTLLKEQSGATATEQEVDRKMEELGMGPKASDREFRLGLKRLLENTESVMGAKEAGVSPEAVQRFRQRGGTTARDLPKPKSEPTRVPATQAMPPGPGGSLLLGPPPDAQAPAGDMVRVKINGKERQIPRSALEAFKARAAERKDTFEVVDG